MPTRSSVLVIALRWFSLTGFLAAVLGVSGCAPSSKDVAAANFGPAPDRCERLIQQQFDLTLFNGAVRSSEQEHLARLLRAKSKVLMAFGACACWGGIPALANFTTKDEIMQRVYRDVPSVAQPEGIFPQTK